MLSSATKRSLLKIVVLLLGSFLIGLAGNLLHPRKLSLWSPVYSLAELSKGQCTASAEAIHDWKMVSVEEAITLCNTSKHLVIADLRPSLEYAQGHIPKAVHLPCHEDKGLSFLTTLEKGATLLIYDRDGTSIELESAIKAAKAQGVAEVYILQGGFSAWQKHGAAESGSCTHCDFGF